MPRISSTLKEFPLFTWSGSQKISGRIYICGTVEERCKSCIKFGGKLETEDITIQGLRIKVYLLF